MDNPLVSIIVPCYNQSKYIRETLNSIIYQTYKNWECIIVNDGSTDNSESVIFQTIKEDNRFKYIKTPNLGVVSARNTSIRNSSGIYIFPLDSDDTIHPNCIEYCINEFLNAPGTILVCPQAEFFFEKQGLFYLPEYSYRDILSFCMIHNSSMFLRKDFDRVGGYRLNMKHGLEDWDFWIALLEPYEDSQVVKLSQPLFFYRVQNESRGINVIKKGKFTDMLDTIVYNNFEIYKQYFPDLFNRIIKYDYHNTMMNKPLIRLMTKFYNKLSKIKRLIKH